jgi:hypothetical protein
MIQLEYILAACVRYGWIICQLISTAYANSALKIHDYPVTKEAPGLIVHREDRDSLNSVQNSKNFVPR